ncbi:YidC/Oxa1 family membrane protein insertase, partial [Francisella tularensis subsp. holarctica]|uniref:YidC/Oxa1 family membrane protein insertase n=1 Tax=Francisella tularensis TaxID=263 RepID=UPI002381BB23
PVRMGLSMFLQQKLSPSPAYPIQSKVMMFLPVIFTFLFASFPSGLVLYGLTNNLISISQHWIITRHYQATHKK